MKQFKKHDVVIVKSHDDNYKLGYVASLMRNDEIVVINDMNDNTNIDEFYQDGTFAYSNDMTIVIKKINDNDILRMFHNNNDEIPHIA